MSQMMEGQFRGVEGVYRGTGFQFVGDGFRVSNYFPSGNRLMHRFSPFILLDYMPPHEWPPTQTQRGVGAHPHRGFETVSIVYEGSVEHHDNAGNHGVIGPGDVQWMTAGAGILHKEYQSREFAQRGGVMHAIQLWVNLPRVHKMTPPSYQTLLNEDMGKAKIQNSKRAEHVDSTESENEETSFAETVANVRVIAGTFEAGGQRMEPLVVHGPAKTFSPVTIFDLELVACGEVPFRLPAHFQAGMLVLRGELVVNGQQPVSEREFVLLKNEPGDVVLRAGEQGALVLVLAGEPIDEPLVQYGPFVMNTKLEIQQAYEDFHAGKFGNPDF